MNKNNEKKIYNVKHLEKMKNVLCKDNKTTIYETYIKFLKELHQNNIEEYNYFINAYDDNAKSLLVKDTIGRSV